MTRGLRAHQAYRGVRRAPFQPSPHPFALIPGDSFTHVNAAGYRIAQALPHHWKSMSKTRLSGVGNMFNVRRSPRPVAVDHEVHLDDVQVNAVARPALLKDSFEARGELERAKMSSPSRGNA